MEGMSEGEGEEEGVEGREREGGREGGRARGVIAKREMYAIAKREMYIYLKRQTDRVTSFLILTFHPLPILKIICIEPWQMAGRKANQKPTQQSPLGSSKSFSRLNPGYRASVPPPSPLGRRRANVSSELEKILGRVCFSEFSAPHCLHT